MNYQELEKYLFEIGEAKFASFSKTLSNSDYQVIGVKNPILKQIIKQHLNDEELDLKDFVLGKYLEVDFIYFGLSLSRLKTSQEQLEFLNKKIKLAKSWAITDCSATFLNKYSFSQYWDFFISNYESSYVYARRMAYVLGLKLYKDKDIVKVLPYIKRNEEYMVMMAEAWLLSVIALVNQDEVYNYLKKLDDSVLKRKTISKICDSFRYSEDSKNRFKLLRK